MRILYEKLLIKVNIRVAQNANSLLQFVTKYKSEQKNTIHDSKEKNQKERSYHKNCQIYNENFLNQRLCKGTMITKS